MCTSPREAGYNASGQITFSKKQYNKELAGFQIPCGQCVECKLERARDWAVRCVHEADSHKENSFITLTYSPENLPSDGKVSKKHFQDFMKRLREAFPNNEIGYLACGEYGSKTKRPHYHACLFGIDFPDKKFVRTSDRGDKVYNSEELTKIWKHGHTEIGQVTFQSAGYVARYVLKKQKDEPEYIPFQLSSKKRAIGKKWLQENWRDVFTHGELILKDGTRTKIPRYYEKWFKAQMPNHWSRYVTETKPKNTQRLQEKAEREHKIFLDERSKRGLNQFNYKSPLARKREIINERIKLLRRKLDDTE